MKKSLLQLAVNKIFILLEGERIKINSVTECNCDGMFEMKMSSIEKSVIAAQTFY